MLELFNPITRLITFNRMLTVIALALVSMLIDWRSMRKRGLKRESLWALILNTGLIGLSIGAYIALVIFAT